MHAVLKNRQRRPDKIVNTTCYATYQHRYQRFDRAPFFTTSPLLTFFYLSIIPHFTPRTACNIYSGYAIYIQAPGYYLLQVRSQIHILKKNKVKKINFVYQTYISWRDLQFRSWRLFLFAIIHIMPILFEVLNFWIFETTLDGTNNQNQSYRSQKDLKHCINFFIWNNLWSKNSVWSHHIEFLNDIGWRNNKDQSCRFRKSYTTL